MRRVASGFAAIILTACAGSESEIVTVSGQVPPEHCAPEAPTNCVVIEHLTHGRIRVYCDRDVEFVVTK